MSLALTNRKAALLAPWNRNPLWSAARAVPSLDLRFAESKSLTDAASGQSLVTFTRASSGTYVGSDGVLQTATTNEPRFDHNPTTGESLGLLVEEQRTNLLLRNEEFDNASWIKTLATVTSNAGIAPNGSTVADKLVGNSTVDAHYVQQNIAGATSGTPYTSSVYAKAAEISRIEILHVIGATLYAQGYDLSNGTLITRVTGGTTAATGGFMQPVGNGWYRCGITQTSDGTSGAMRVTLRSGSTVGFDATSQGVLLWGAQLEAGAFPTSYIPTTTATATRSADVASITGTNFSSWYSQSEGTVFADATIANTGSNRFIVGASDATVNEEVALYWNTVFNSLVTDGAASQANSFGGTVTAGSRALHSFAYKANDFQGYGNAVALSADTSGTLPTADRLTIGSRVNSTIWTNGTIRRLTYWPKRLSNPSLQAITQ